MGDDLPTEAYTTPLEKLLDTRSIDEFKKALKEPGGSKFKSFDEWLLGFQHYDELATKECSDQKNPKMFMECKKKLIDNIKV